MEQRIQSKIYSGLLLALMLKKKIGQLKKEPLVEKAVFLFGT